MRGLKQSEWANAFRIPLLREWLAIDSLTQLKRVHLLSFSDYENLIFTGKSAELTNGHLPEHPKRPIEKALCKAVTSTRFRTQHLEYWSTNHVYKLLWESPDSYIKVLSKSEALEASSPIQTRN